MIDYVKIWVKTPNTPELLRHLELEGSYNTTTGEVFGVQKKTYHHCTITLNNGGLFFEGSLHKLWNSLNGEVSPNYVPEKYKGYNGNQFDYNKIIEVRDHLTDLLRCTPQQLRFLNMEIGINTTVNFDPKTYIKGLLMHRGKQFDSMADGNYKQAEHSAYLLKIYNKSKQYGMNKHTLRVELKMRKAREIHKMGIYTFADVTPMTLNNGKKLLLDAFNSSIHYDHTIRKEELTEREQIMIYKYSNPNFWEELNPRLRHRPKQRLFNIITNHSDNIHKKVVAEIEQKYTQTNPLYESKTQPLKSSQKTHFEHNNTQGQKNTSSIIIHTSNIGCIIMHTPPKKCKVTGLDISMQKEGSFLLSHTGLKWYYKNDRKEYDRMEYFYLGSKWRCSDLKTRIKELAHNIRNYENNRNLRILKQRYLFQGRLFD